MLEKYRARLDTADCLLNPALAQGPDGEVTTYLGYKGMITLEFVCSGLKWGKGPQRRPLYTSRATVLDSPVWRLIDALRSMYDPDTNRILIDGYYDAIREPNDEERQLMQEIVTNMKHRILAYERDNIEAFRDDWTSETAAHHLMFDTTFNVAGVSAPAAFPHRASGRDTRAHTTSIFSPESSASPQRGAAWGMAETITPTTSTSWSADRGGWLASSRPKHRWSIS